ncbi:MAG: translation initiation factor IF-3 [Clostridiales bacterium GWF2_36_10]|nr:MAG: translation initiation factor IF-3 [Clostridiales bacterium GWF2_36_10]HAN20393.1 translation initiation factor IF-3 [Clostridiales bacterium]
MHGFLFYILWGCLSISKKTLINEEIKANEVRVVGSDGKQLGVLRTEQALRLANEESLDLVEIAPEAQPPVCKIMDYGKYRFEKEKREKEIKKKQQIVELKELQLKCRIDTHDFETKMKHAHRFLTQGDKVKVLVKFYGREMAHTERGIALLERFADGCGELCVVEKTPLLDGRNMIMILAPKKTNITSKGNDKNGQDENT